MEKAKCKCPKVKKPVCGMDEKTYANECVAKCADVEKCCDGKCPCQDGCCSSEEMDKNSKGVRKEKKDLKGAKKMDAGKEEEEEEEDRNSGR